MLARSLACFQRFVLIALLLGSLFPRICIADDHLQKEPGHVYICTFNIYILGNIEAKYKPGYTGTAGIPQRIKNLAKVLAVGAFDLIVIEEVKAGEVAEWVISDLQTELKNTHALDYQHFISDTIGLGFQIQEAIAFLYNPTVVTPEVITGQTGMMELIRIPTRQMVRTQWRAGDFDFTLIAAHFVYSHEIPQDTCYMVLREILTTPTPSSYSQDPDIIVLGDFNRFGLKYNSVKHLDYHPGEFLVPNVTIFDPAVHGYHTVKKPYILGKGIPDDDSELVSTTVAKSAYVYDMFLLTSDVAEEFPPGTGQGVFGVDFGILQYDEPTGFGYQTGAEALDHNALKAAYSDHRPLWMRFRTNAGKLDQTPSGPGTTVIQSYVGTQSGKKFHLPGCHTIANFTVTKTWPTRQDALAERMPCGVCKP